MLRIKKINSEKQKFHEYFPYGSDFTLNQICDDEDDISQYLITMNGPNNTPFQGGVFKMHFKYPIDYPFKPPQVKFMTKIYHPNIDKQGKICLNILREDCWALALSLSTIILSIQQLLDDPFPDEPSVPEIALVFKTDKQRYNNTARQWTKKYAQ